jgi:hypothetical protein
MCVVGTGGGLTKQGIGFYVGTHYSGSIGVAQQISYNDYNVASYGTPYPYYRYPDGTLKEIWHTGNFNPSNYALSSALSNYILSSTVHYSTTSNNNSSILYIPDNVDGPNYCVDTIESSNSNTLFYYMWLDGQPNWTSYYNYMRHQLIRNNKTVDVTV